MMLLASDDKGSKRQLTATIPGLEFLWEHSLGDPKITVAVLDGPVDLSHPCFQGANLTRLSTLVTEEASQNFASQHGTHIASILFGQHHSDSSVWGIAPNCRGLIVPVFKHSGKATLAPCSQVDLARAITQAVEAGAQVINISGGQLATSTTPDSFLANAINLCKENNVLVVAAAGNDGCNCLHIPAAVESVLAVGAMDAVGRPIDFSNWGSTYQSQGILAPGERVLGAQPGGRTLRRNGTSFAAPIVSGIVALLLSIQKQRGQTPNPSAIRSALLAEASACNLPNGSEAQRCLAGSLNIFGTYDLLTQGGNHSMSTLAPDDAMHESHAADTIQPIAPIEQNLPTAEPEAKADALMPSEVETSTLLVVPDAAVAQENVLAPKAVFQEPESSVVPSSGCGCGGNGGQLTYAMGQIGIDFGSEARRDWFQQATGVREINVGAVLDLLKEKPWFAQSLIWTLNSQATPIYAILPMGSYADELYKLLLSFITGEHAYTNMVAVPGYSGGGVTLLSGQTVPILSPDIRGLHNWGIYELVNNSAEMYGNADKKELEEGLKDYLNRIYYEYRNLGITPEERALNFSATNAFQISEVMSHAAAHKQSLGSINVQKSPICRPDSGCYDVEVKFFDPENLQRAKTTYMFTVDVSDVVPVGIGEIRRWASM